MTRNLGVIDTKPKNSAVVDSKPQNAIAIDAKPKNGALGVEFGDIKYYTVVLAKGMATGIPGQTYPEEITISSSFSP